MSRAERIPDTPAPRASPGSRERREPPEDRLGREPHAEPVEDAGPELRGERDDVARPRALMRDDGERVAGGEADGPIRLAGSRARASTRAQSAPLTIGFVKNEPQLRRFGSRGSSTMDLERRMASTV